MSLSCCLPLQAFLSGFFSGTQLAASYFFGSCCGTRLTRTQCAPVGPQWILPAPLVGPTVAESGGRAAFEAAGCTFSLPFAQIFCLFLTNIQKPQIFKGQSLSGQILLNIIWIEADSLGKIFSCHSVLLLLKYLKKSYKTVI